MRFVLIAFCFASAAVSLLPSTLRSTEPACMGPDTVSRILYLDIVRFGSSTDPQGIAFRDRLRVPQVGAEDVELVTSDSVCQVAADAYRREVARFGNGSESRVSGRVYLFRVGSVQIATDTAYYYHTPGVWTEVVFDSAWRRLGHY